MYILDTVLIIIFLILFPFLLKSFIVVYSHEVVIVERFGHYHRTIEAGTHIILPFIEKRKATLDMREQILKTPAHFVKTKDNTTIKVSLKLFYAISDPKKVVYETNKIYQTIQNYSVIAINEIFNNISSSEIEKQKNEINSELLSTLRNDLNKCGCIANHVEFEYFITDMINFENQEDEFEYTNLSKFKNESSSNENNPIKEY